MYEVECLFGEHKAVGIISSIPLPFLKIANMPVSLILHEDKKIQVANIRKIQMKIIVRYLAQYRIAVRKKILMRTGERWGWRDGSAIMSTDCSSRGPEFNP